jgi:hypothetical protein
MTAALGCGGSTCLFSPPPWGSYKTKEAVMSFTVIYPKTRTKRELYKDVPILTDNDLVWEPDGEEEIFYEVAIDLAAVEVMARRAAYNSGQVSRAGPLRVSILERSRIR